MPSVCVVGSQWGDEGKGKIVDILGESADYIVRYQGGNNAGHTVVVDGKKYAFHALPVGVLRGVRSLIASGVVLDPYQLQSEIKSFGKEVNLGIDPRTAIIMPWHKDLDNARESLMKRNTGSAIGTTSRGIGPCYEDDRSRIGIRFFELLKGYDYLEKRFTEIHDVKKKILEGIYGYVTEYSLNKVLYDYALFGTEMKDYFDDVSLDVHNALKSGKNVLFEGAQGTLLDIKFGNYPKVTSSHPMTSSVFDSVGISPGEMRKIGVMKAYVTKVGSGPVVTCLDKGLWPVDESLSEPEANYIRKKGGEKGTTTGRPRRVGWLDAVVLKYTQRINGFDELAMMKLDCISGMDKIRMAVAYEHDGKKLSLDDYRSWDSNFLGECKPVYEEFNGFEDISGIRHYSKLPRNAKRYISRVEEIAEVPVTFVSVGPGRDENIVRKGFKKF